MPIQFRAMVLALLPFGFAAAPSVVQGQSLLLGNKVVSLGAPREHVLADLRASYRVDGADAPVSSWAVWSKDGPPYRYFGYVFFQDGVLASAHRDWSPRNRDSQQAAVLAIIGALKSLDGSTCSVKDMSYQSPQVDEASIEINCGARTIHVSFSRHELGVGWGVGETITATSLFP